MRCNDPTDDMKIRKVIFRIKPLKALGVDGLHAIFYQPQWSIVGYSLCQFVKEIFHHGSIPSEINRTLLVLILKTDNPVSLIMYHPISLCTTFYKTITKIIANTLQSILLDLVRPQQTGFFLSQHIIENIVVAP